MTYQSRRGSSAAIASSFRTRLTSYEPLIERKRSAIFMLPERRGPHETTYRYWHGGGKPYFHSASRRLISAFRLCRTNDLHWRADGGLRQCGCAERR